MAGAGSLFGLWAMAAIIGGLRQVHWHISELARQLLLASGLMQPIHTMVDFYTHIKGIEYIICVMFFIAFPMFYRYVNRQTHHIKRPVRK